MTAPSTAEDDSPVIEHTDPAARPDSHLVSERVVRTIGENICVFYPHEATDAEKLTHFIVADETLLIDRHAMR